MRNRRGGVLVALDTTDLDQARAWARATVLRGRVFGVVNDDVSFVDLLAASLPR